MPVPIELTPNDEISFSYIFIRRVFKFEILDIPAPRAYAPFTPMLLPQLISISKLSSFCRKPKPVPNPNAPDS